MAKGGTGQTGQGSVIHRLVELAAGHRDWSPGRLSPPWLQSCLHRVFGRATPSPYTPRALASVFRLFLSLSPLPAACLASLRLQSPKVSLLVERHPLSCQISLPLNWLTVNCSFSFYLGRRGPSITGPKHLYRPWPLMAPLITSIAPRPLTITGLLAPKTDRWRTT